MMRGPQRFFLVRLATREDAEKLMGSDSGLFGAGAIIVPPFDGRDCMLGCAERVPN
jgi:hypothetical protein